MSFYLKHFFNPDLHHLNLKPCSEIAEASGSNLYNLGYVQNVIKGQVLAEVVPLSEAGPNPDPRFILESSEPPLGFNTVVDPAHPQYILAAVNGYVFYSEGRITVKHLLNVRQDVSFQTGNIHFVGDMCVHGSVRAGFSVHANNVRIMGMVEGGSVDARQDLVIDVGARGGTGEHCVLEARGKILSPFLEKVEVRSRSHVITEKYCLYCTAYVGGNLVVRESLYGTTANAYGSVFVGKQLGDGEKVILIEDVMTSGKALREMLPKLAAAAKVEATGMVISVDRQEKALNSELSAVQEAYKEFGIPVYSIVTMQDIIDAIENGIIGGGEYLEKMKEYRSVYGA